MNLALKSKMAKSWGPKGAHPIQEDGLGNCLTFTDVFLGPKQGSSPSTEGNCLHKRCFSGAQRELAQYRKMALLIV